MRNLTAEETEDISAYGEPEDGEIAIEATIQELADMNAGTACGTVGNTCFKALAEKGYKHRKCRGWFLKEPAKTALNSFIEYWKDDLKAQRKAAYERTKKSLEERANDPEQNRPYVNGMFHIKIQTEKTAMKIENIANEAGGSLRFDGESDIEGFMVFEIE